MGEVVFHSVIFNIYHAAITYVRISWFSLGFPVQHSWNLDTWALVLVAASQWSCGALLANRNRPGAPPERSVHAGGAETDS